MRHTAITSAAVLLATVVVAAGLAACSDDSTSPASSAAPAEPGAKPFVGELDVPDTSGPAPLLGVEVLDGRVRAFVCDESELWGWFEGRITGDEVSLPAASGTAAGGSQPQRLTLRVRRDRLTGTLALGDGTRFPFTLAPAAGTDGLYRAGAVGSDGRVHATTATGNTAEGQIAPNGDTTLTLTAGGETTKVGGLFEGFQRTDAAAYGEVRTVAFGKRIAGKLGTDGPQFIDLGSSF